MRSWITVTFVTLLSILSLEGCVTKQTLPELPSQIGDKGLLVARFYVLGMQGMENANVTIDGKLVPSSMRDGYIAMALEPGEHKLSQIRAAGHLLTSSRIDDATPYQLAKRGGGAPTFIYIPGSSYEIHYTTLSVDRSFRIEPGAVTNLGLIVYIPVEDAPGTKRATVDNSRQFQVVAVENNGEIKSFLETNYPRLFSSLQSRDISLATGQYLDPKRLPDLRRAIAYHELRGPHVIGTPSRLIVYGRAGTVVSIQKQSQGTKPAYDILDTETLADIVGAASDGEQVTFLTSDAKLLSLNGNKISKSPFPYRVHPVRLHSLGKNGLIAVDNHLRIMTTRSPNDPWTSYEGAVIESARSDINVASDGAGAYVSLGNLGIPDAVYYVQEGEFAPRLIPGPENRSGALTTDIHRLVAREVGLFVLFNKSNYYFWSKATQNWNLYSLPPGNCGPMRIDDDGRNLKVECSSINYFSTDQDANWKRPEA